MTVPTLLRCLRIRQWTKNILVFAALVFARHAHETGPILRSIAAFLLFSLASGAVYIFNDLRDIDRDRQHPVKRLRPIASGDVSPGIAYVILAVILTTAIAASFLLDTAFGAVLIIYTALQFAYTVSLKNVVILDVLVISLGFLLRVIAGAVVINVPISNWILVCTMLLALFLVLSKRRNELTVLGEKAYEHRIILSEYSPYLLDQMIGVVTSATLVAYMIFTLSAETIEKFGNNMVLTVPFVLYGIFRYLYLVHQKKAGGQPEEILLTDRPIRINVLLYALTALLVIYF